MDLNSFGKENMSVMKVPTSPSFLKPKPIKLKKKGLKPTALPLDEVDVNKHHGLPDVYLIRPPKTQNPFRRNINKRKREPEEISDDLNSIWKQINNEVSENSEETKALLSPIVPSMLDESALSSFSDNISASFQSPNEKKYKPKAKVLPVDWSLKTKIRFTSSTQFPTRGSFRTFEEVNGTIGFVRCLHSGEADCKSSDVHSSHGAKFFQHCLVWSHPNLPWLNLFPRNDSLVCKSNSSSVVLDTVAQERLHSNWCDSFRSLYQLVRLYQCPYFYMCASTFTVLFRCAGASSIPVIHALITPTTKGFRKALKEEGIVFTMPLYNSRDSGESGFEDLLEDTLPLSNSTEYTDKRSDSDDDCSDPIEEDEEPNTWLESLGLSQDNFPSLSKKKRLDDSTLRVDHKPESLIYVEDSETQALVNFLLNSNFCTTKLGPMAGVPPTLLAPTAFLGGTLQSLKIRHGKVKNEKNCEMESIEVNGPILPHTVHSLCSLFSTTQEDGFSVVLSSHHPTTSFSMVNPQSPMLPCIFAKNNVTDCGLPETFVNQMCSKTEEFAFSSIKLENGLFTWS